MDNQEIQVEIIPVTFRVNSSDLRTLTIPAGGTGEFSVTPFISPHISSGSSLNSRIDTNLEDGQRIIISIILS